MDHQKLRNALRPGHTLHWYRIERVLGQGGFGITYLAYDTNLDQHVAIKEYLPMELAVRDGDFSVYPASQAQHERYRWGLERFLIEARTLARFKHPAIVRVLSVFEANNTACMVMEYQQGSSLQEVLKTRKVLPEPELTALAMALLDGLEVIHAQGFIHRDIKPGNIFIRRDGHPVLLDFGSARQALGEQTQILTSVVSPGYAPFEQYYSRSDRQGPWTDIYGLGATLYRCIAGRSPMAAIDRSEAILKAERDVFVSASELGAGAYSPAFLAAVDSALEFDEKKRPQSIAEWRRTFVLPEAMPTPPTEPFASALEAAGETALSVVVGDTVPQAEAIVLNPDTAPSSSRARAGSGRGRAPHRRHTSGHAASALRPVAPVAIALILILALVAGGGTWAWRQGWVALALLDFNRVSRLVEQGDRAFAAGREFEPARLSALAYYRRAWDAHPGHEDAARGLDRVGERLQAAIAVALEADDDARVAQLAPLLDRLPAGEVDTTLIEARLAERERDAARIAELLDAADGDLAAGRLLGPGTDNALARYRAVQVLEPDSAAARSGLERLAAALAARGSALLARGDLDGAAQWHEQARRVDTAPAAVGDLGAALEDQRRASERAQSVEALLEQAAADLAANRLTSPAGDNALERYRRVAELEPGNAAAQTGIRSVHDRYLALASQALARQEHDNARQYVEHAAAALPDSAAAPALAREIDAAAGQRRALTAAAREVEREARATALRAQAERARTAAAAERLPLQAAATERLATPAARRAEEERLARAAEMRARDAAEKARPRIVLD